MTRRTGKLSVVALALAPAACASIYGVKEVPTPVDGGDDGTLPASSGGTSGSGGASSGSDNDSGATSGSSGASSGSSGASSGSSGVTSSSSGVSSTSSSSGVSSSSSSGSSNSSSSGSSSGTGSSSGAPEGGVLDYSVYQHHKNGTRNGVYVDPAFTRAAAATTHVLGYMGSVTTSVYAQPLYVQNGPGGNETFVVATENNYVTAFNATTGAKIWETGPTVIGTPVTSGLPCGNVNPLGITGTPFISNGVVYFDAMVVDPNVTAKHLVYALNLADGTKVSGWPIDVHAAISTFTSSTQNQRGALQLVNDVLYVPYGGLYGDCGTYYGWVVGFPLGSPSAPTSWHTTATGGGVWGTGALPTDGTSIFPVTGNTFASSTTWAGGEAVIRLTPGLTFSGNATDYYAPSNWKSLDNSDLDLGGAGEVLFDMPGATTPHLVAAGGKDGNLYVLNRDNLGGVGGATVLTQHVATAEINGAPAVYTTTLGTYVVFHVANGTGTSCSGGTSGNLVAVKITAGSPFTASIAWCSSQSGLGSPMVTTTDGTSESIVWAANNHLWGFNGDTGAAIAGGTSGATNTTMSASIQGFNVPIAAKGKIAVGVNGQLYVFSP